MRDILLDMLLIFFLSLVFKSAFSLITFLSIFLTCMEKGVVVLAVYMTVDLAVHLFS